MFVFFLFFYNFYGKLLTYFKNKKTHGQETLSWCVAEVFKIVVFVLAGATVFFRIQIQVSLGFHIHFINFAAKCLSRFRAAQWA